MHDLHVYLHTPLLNKISLRLPSRRNPMESEHAHYPIPKPSDLFNKLVFLQADLIYNALLFLFSPISTLLSLLSETFHRAQDTKATVESSLRKVPSDVSYGVALLLKKLTYGFLGAAFMCMLMLLLLLAAVVVGVGLTRIWVEDPVIWRERLHFDYTHPHPKAVFGSQFNNNNNIGRMGKKRHLGIPVGHTFYVSVLLFMPESDFNREVGVFQLNAELLTTNGDVITSSSQPCMLRFRSTPIRITRTFLLSFPLLLGISSESQKLNIETLKHKEVSHRRSSAIRVSLIPRVGTSSLPELYESQILINSELPWPKQLLHRWKWTCYLWMSVYLYVLFLVILIFLWRPFFFQVSTMADVRDDDERAPADEEAEEMMTRDEMAEITVELLRKWQEMRRKRKAAIFSHGGMVEEPVSSSASSASFERGYVSGGFDEEIGDSESECLEGTEQ